MTSLTQQEDARAQTFRIEPGTRCSSATFFGIPQTRYLDLARDLFLLVWSFDCWLRLALIGTLWTHCLILPAAGAQADTKRLCEQ